MRCFWKTQSYESQPRDKVTLALAYSIKTYLRKSGKFVCGLDPKPYSIRAISAIKGEGPDIAHSPRPRETPPTKYYIVVISMNPMRSEILCNFTLPRPIDCLVIDNRRSYVCFLFLFFVSLFQLPKASEGSQKSSHSTLQIPPFCKMQMLKSLANCLVNTIYWFAASYMAMSLHWPTKLGFRPTNPIYFSIFNCK